MVVFQVILIYLCWELKVIYFICLIFLGEKNDVMLSKIIEFNFLII